MKYLLTTFLFCFLSIITKAQITATVKNLTDHLLIPYINNWVVNEDNIETLELS